ncbi:squalene--hopene cyclase [Halobacillus litoralis]|uniref:squalene--hopene cyclase n=1 Tax=Halobacillus litoralis TaxID=45668 RepID=UPI0024903C91|nr:squalene--hopene cyclase [Halobacillus litoralis]
MNRFVASEMERLTNILKKDQSPDGSWDYSFETGVSTDAYMIILLRSLEIHEEKLVQALVERIISKQEKNGAWKVFYDEDQGNLSATIEAYYGLLYSGFVHSDAPNMLKAKQFILKQGGLNKAGMFTKIMLALTGQEAWPNFFPIPLEAILLPVYSPLNIYDISVFGRANIVPIMLLAHKKYRLTTSQTPDLSHLYAQRDLSGHDLYWEQMRTIEWRNYLSSLTNSLQSKFHTLSHLEEIAAEQAKQYMLKRIEPDGTLLNYFSATFLMIYALLSLGFSKKDKRITNAVNGLKSMATFIDGKIHMQYTTAAVWNTSLISYALQEAGITENAEVIQKANRYLFSRQQYKYGDWVVHNTCTRPGGWGFSNLNTIHPDVDDTTASLRAVRRNIASQPDLHQVWERGTQWGIAMQNNDGGWPSFERNVDKKILNLLPVQGAKFLLLDPSTADLTGRTLEFLGNFTNLNQSHSVIKRGVDWLRKDQKQNGSWYGRWGICYIYGTWAAVTGLMACGSNRETPMVRKAVQWLKEIQNEDGGWGESCKSDTKKSYVPLNSSTLTHTAWAVDALIAASPTTTTAIENGIQFLIEEGNNRDWTSDYPKGQGMGGAFYIHYHSYRYIWPLLTLSHYKQKFLSNVI